MENPHPRHPNNELGHALGFPKTIQLFPNQILLSLVLLVFGYYTRKILRSFNRGIQNRETVNLMVEKENSRSLVLSLIWVPILVVIGLLVTFSLITYYQNDVLAAPLKDFNKMVVTGGFHHISIASGQHWDVSYEQNYDRVFEGEIRHISMNHEPNFPIISYDILVTSGDFSDPKLVSTSVENHHFTWISTSHNAPQGTINLLHTVPKDQVTEEKLSAIKNGDKVLIRGWDILRIDGYSKKDQYIGYWQDSGCNTTLVTDVTIE
jgi:hypothetical protein